MFNPYFSPQPEAKPPAPAEGPKLSGLLEKLGHLETDDLVLAFLIFLLAREEGESDLWPLLAALLYLIL